jgi:DNA-binding MarR family transcriptional regulator
LFLDGSAAFLAAHGFSAPPRSASTILLLHERGPLAITEIAQTLKLSHPLIIRLVAALSDQRLVREQEDPYDQRRRLIVLTPEGKRQAERLIDLSRIAADAYRTLGEEIGVDLLAMFERLEAAIANRSIEQRLNDRMASSKPKAAARLSKGSVRRSSRRRRS